MTAIITHSYSSNLILANSKGVFSKSNATLTSFSIYVEPNLLPNETFSLNVQFGGQQMGSPIDIVGGYDFNINIQLKPCDIGHYLLNNACLICPDGTYSFEEKPTNVTVCHLCPENGKCTNGNFVIPVDGFWNFNPQDTVIFKCENPFACRQGCTKGYFGYVCHECDVRYGKTLMRLCKNCNESYMEFHILRACFKWFLLGVLSYFQNKLIQNLHDQNNRVVLSAVNILVYHSLIFAMSSRFQDSNDSDLTTFYEIQSVFSFLENNLFMIYCMFPDYRNYSFYFIIFLYFLLIPIFQMTFIIGFHCAVYFLNTKRNMKPTKPNKNKPKSIFFSEIAKEIIQNCFLLFFNNLITLFYYFVGLVFYFNIDSEISVSFSEIGLSTFEFYFLFFLSFLTILLLFWFPVSFFFKGQPLPLILLIFDSEYKEGHKKLSFIHFICLFFMVILSQYASIGFVFARFVRNIFMMYLGILVSFQSFVFKEIQFFKIFSIIALICSMIQQKTINITMNVAFYLILIIFIFKNFIRRTKKII